MMIATLTNFGDRLGVQFPKSLLKNTHISENDDVEVLIKDNSIIIKRKESKKHLTTKERIATFYEMPENGTILNEVNETDWGKPQGKEI
jgi:antitoxin component of MazEF toxin-antitoxin module